MAKVSGQAVPPSLQDAYDTLLYTTTGVQRPGTRVSIQPGARSQEPADPGSPLAQLATAAATWLRDQWVADTDPLARSTFYRDRKEEILAGEFPATYWYQATMLSDQTERATPTVRAWIKTWNPAYWDPLRQPSVCIYKYPSSTYATPSGRGTAQQPAPGWAGSVHGVQWQDDWMAQRKITFALPIQMSKPPSRVIGQPPPPAPRPVAILADITIEANATVRGNRTWFSLTTAPTYWHNYGWDLSNPLMFSLWNRDDGYPYEIPGDAQGGWVNSIERRVIRSGYHLARWSTKSNCDRCAVRIATPPSLGMYYSRNDAVSVYHHGSVALYIAKGPHG